jgi:hypothetical protein
MGRQRALLCIAGRRKTEDGRRKTEVRLSRRKTEFVQVNKHLLRDHVQRNLWTDDFRRKIIARNRSVQHLDLPWEGKELYYALLAQRTEVGSADGRRKTEVRLSRRKTECVQVNKHLLRDHAQRNLWTDDFRRQIIARNRSVQHLGLTMGKQRLSLCIAGEAALAQQTKNGRRKGCSTDGRRSLCR